MGGHIKFKHETCEINAIDAIRVQNEICDILSQNNIQFLKIGSVGHKKTTDTHSDIDIAIKCDTIEQLHDMLCNIFDDCLSFESYYVVSMPYAYIDSITNDEKYVQCDFMLMHDERYTAFRYECPDYANNESRYKVGAKIMFVNMLLNHCLDDVDVGLDTTKYFGKYDFSPIGLYRNVLYLNEFKEHHREFVTTDVDKIMKMMFNDEYANTNTFRTLENLWDAIHTDAFKYPDEVKNIECNFFINCFKKGWKQIRPQNFNLHYWTNEEIWCKLLPYQMVHRINNILGNNEEK